MVDPLPEGLSAAMRPLNLAPQVKEAYALILRRQGIGIASLSAELGAPREEVASSMAVLRDLGLVLLSDEGEHRYYPTDPDQSLPVLLRSRQTELDDARSAITLVQEIFDDSYPASDANRFVEVVTGPEAVARRIMQLQATAEKEVLVFDKGPYVVPGNKVADEEVEQLRRGVEVRVVYESDVLLNPQNAESVRQMRALGEQARLVDLLPAKLMVTDRRIAMVPLGLGPRGRQGIVVLSADPILNMLCALFESTWRGAAPLDTDRAVHGELLTTEQSEILALALAGLTDEAMTRQLGISRRTVQRRLHSLMATLEVSGRAQLAVRAAQLGLLTD